MAGALNFLENTDQISMQKIYHLYQKVIAKKSQLKKSKDSSKELRDLDLWYQQVLPEIINKRSDERYITGEEIVKLMQWKLSRGKFRPRLVELAASNKDEDVIHLSKTAFKKAKSGKLEDAIQCLSKLKGIGPATASAILAAGAPDQAAFMADEAVYGVLGKKSLRYSLAEYMEYITCLKYHVNRFKNEDSEFGWNVHKVELAVWTHYVGSELEPDLINEALAGTCNRKPKRKRDETETIHKTRPRNIRRKLTQTKH